MMTNKKQESESEKLATQVKSPITHRYGVFFLLLPS